MRDPHVRFCERRGGVISRAYSTIAVLLERSLLPEMTSVHAQSVKLNVTSY